jgi:hypothetical protein
MKSFYLFINYSKNYVCVCVIEVFIKNKMEKNGLDLNEKSIM